MVILHLIVIRLTIIGLLQVMSRVSKLCNDKELGVV